MFAQPLCKLQFPALLIFALGSGLAIALALPMAFIASRLVFTLASVVRGNATRLMLEVSAA